MQRPRPTPGIDGSLEPPQTASDSPGFDDAPRPRVEAAQLARWESEGGALRESEQRAS